MSAECGMRNVMDGLLPIIRRVRRPLVPVAGAAGGADAKPAAVPAKARPEPAGATEGEPVEGAQSKRKDRRG